MTCAHVLGLIDAGPFADYPRAHLEAAWAHAHQCAVCGPALEAATSLTADLTALPRPVPPPDLSAAVLARIARLEQTRSNPVDAATAHTGTPSIARDWPAWATAAGGVAAALAIAVATPGGDLTAFDIVSPRVGPTTVALLAMPSANAWTATVVAGLMLYLAGLFAVLGRGSGVRS
jgi:hypothetical protein